jgi:predicted phosphoribosyltransferase
MIIGGSRPVYASLLGTLSLGSPQETFQLANEYLHVGYVALDVLVVCKLRVPGHEELAMGAIASGMVRVEPGCPVTTREDRGKWGDASDKIEAAVSSRIWTTKSSF